MVHGELPPAVALTVQCTVAAIAAARGFSCRFIFFYPQNYKHDNRSQNYKRYHGPYIVY